MGLAAGQIALDTDLSQLIAKTYQKPIGRLVTNATQAIPITTQTAVLFPAEDFDTHGFHSTSVNTARITPTVPGYYRFTGTGFLALQAGATQQQMVWRKNGTTNLATAAKRVGDTVSNWSLGPSIVTQPMNGTTDYMELTFILGVALSTASSIQFNTSVEWEYWRDL